MKVYFMYDCHLFAKVGTGASTREAMEQRARELFAEDPSGSLFARDSRERGIADLGGYTLKIKGEPALRAFFDRVEEHANWEARG